VSPNWSDDEGRCHFVVDGLPCYESGIGCPMHRAGVTKRKRESAADLRAQRDELAEALRNLAVWAEWHKQRRGPPRMGEPNTGALEAARAALSKVTP
jgi:hypothetical protein